MSEKKKLKGEKRLIEAEDADASGRGRDGRFAVRGASDVGTGTGPLPSPGWAARPGPYDVAPCQNRTPHE